jgi:hypothetical protein
MGWAASCNQVLFKSAACRHLGDCFHAHNLGYVKMYPARNGDELRQQSVSAVKISGDNRFYVSALRAIRTLKKGPLVFANGGPKKATGRGDARWLLIPKEPRRDFFVARLQLSPNSPLCSGDENSLIPLRRCVVTRGCRATVCERCLAILKSFIACSRVAE